MEMNMKVLIYYNPKDVHLKSYDWRREDWG